MNKKTIDDYLSLPYSIEVRQLYAEDGSISYFAKVIELPGCMTEADSKEELWEMIDDAKRMWLEVALEDGIPIPEPVNERKYSGRFVLRTPISLHEQLTENAKREGVSLNQYIVSQLSLCVGFNAHKRESVQQEI